VRGFQRTIAVFAAGVIVAVVIGSALGVLWWRLAPRVPLLLRPNGDPWPGYQPEGYIGADVAFGALGLMAGVLVTIGLVRMRREQLLSVLIVSVLTGVVGSAAMWFVGTRLGSVDIEGLIATTTEDLTVDAPLVVTLPGVYVVWPLAAALVVTLVAAREVWRDWRQEHSVR
jgi:xanthine/uracil permease